MLAARVVIARGAAHDRAGSIEWVGEEGGGSGGVPRMRSDLRAPVVNRSQSTVIRTWCSRAPAPTSSRAPRAAVREIARAGGGILATVRAVGTASAEKLFDESAPRLAAR